MDRELRVGRDRRVGRGCRRNVAEMLGEGREVGCDRSARQCGITIAIVYPVRRSRRHVQVVEP